MIPQFDGIDHIHIYVRDRQAAERWYAAVLGLQRVEALAFWAPDGGPLTLGNADGSVHLALFERPLEKNHAVVAFGVSAAAFLAWREHLAVALGQALPPVDHGASWSLYFRDPDGNPYEITSYDDAALRPQLASASHQ